MYCRHYVLFGKFYGLDSGYELKTSVWVESTSVREVIAYHSLTSLEIYVFVLF
ncbi:hypothetical protein Hanom_Chr14g01281211 [Helianthus anomalus]